MAQAYNVLMSPSTPIQAWPRQQHRGRPGYSAAHFAAVSPQADTPLSVALTIENRQYRERVAAEVERRREAGEGYEEILAWQSEQFSFAKGQERLAAVEGSFERVIELLESVPQYPAFKALVRWAKREQRRSVQKKR